MWDGHAITPKDESTLCHMATASGATNAPHAALGPESSKVDSTSHYAPSIALPLAGRLNQWFAGVCDNLYRAFLPDSKDVTPDYWEWLHWRLTQRFFSSTMQNLSTQSLLLALGMGAKKTIAASAAINWCECVGAPSADPSRPTGELQRCCAEAVPVLAMAHWCCVAGAGCSRTAWGASRA